MRVTVVGATSGGVATGVPEDGVGACPVVTVVGEAVDGVPGG